MTALKTHLLMNGSEWNGVCKYEDGEWFPFVLRVSKAEKNTVEGTMHWTTLNAVTRFLGIITKNYFKFREYEVKVVALMLPTLPCCTSFYC